jgi:hypothetical protein
VDKVAWFGFRAEARAAENTRIVHWVTERRRSPGRNAFQMSFLWELIGTAWVQKVGPREPCVIYTHASLPTLRKGWPLCDRQTGDAKGDQLAQLAAPDPRPPRHLRRL